MRSAFLRIEGLTKSFGNFVALHDITLEVDENEFVCFLGPSGCGKTTLLRAIAGLDVQTTGRIIQGGKDISALPPAARDFGIVFQSYALFPNLTVWKNIGYGLRGRLGRKERAARIEELLALVGLTGSERKYPAQLSGGQQQRVAIARALAPRPRLLLLDEPLNALDSRVRVRLRREIKALQQRLQLTTIMVTHDQDEALTTADRVVVMNHGTIEQVATPMDVYRRPASPFVADFIGSMNFLKGRAVSARDVRVGASTLTIDRSEQLGAEEEVVLCLRPEDIAVRNVSETASNSAQACIDDIEFFGSFCRARLSVPALTPDGITAEFSMNAMTDLDLRVGKSVTVGLPPARLRLFRANGAALQTTERSRRDRAGPPLSPVPART